LIKIDTSGPQGNDMKS